MTPKDILDGLLSGNATQIKDSTEAARTSNDPALFTTLSNGLNNGQTPLNDRLPIVDALVQRGDKAAIKVVGEAMLQSKEPGLKSVCLAELEKLNPQSSLPYLVDAADWVDARATLEHIVAKTANELSDANPNVQQAAQKNADQIMQALADESRLPALRAPLASLWGSVKLAYPVKKLCEVLQAELLRDEDASDDVLKAIVQALREIDNADAVPELCTALERSRGPIIRRHIAGSLGRFTQAQHAIPALLGALMSDPDVEVRRAAKTSLEKLSGWQAKTDACIDVVRDKGIERATLNAVAVAEAISSDTGQQDSRKLVADHLIYRAVEFSNEARVTAVLAALIIACLGGSTAAVGERIALVETQRQLPPEKLEKLRIEVGGASALDPLLKQLEENLQTYFRVPIHELNKATQASWQDTILWAKRGFVARMVMSVAVFAVGLILVLVSFVAVLTGTLKPEQVVGMSVALIGGLITAMLMAYSGPLRDIYQSVNGLGISSAAFMAFVHTILQASHTFSFRYLRKDMTYDELQKSAAIIEKLLNNTVRQLKGSEPKADESQKQASSNSAKQDNTGMAGSAGAASDTAAASGVEAPATTKKP